MILHHPFPYKHNNKIMDLKISISEIKKNTVFYIAYVDNPNNTGISKEQFITSVKVWAHSYFKEVIGHQVPLSIFKDIEDHII